MTHARLELGRRGEEAAERHLAGLGHEILARNFRCAAGEIDLVTRIGERVVFVEVRGRQGERFGAGIESVDARKRRRLCRAAAMFLAERGLGEPWARFDVVSIDWRDGQACVDHFENAFECGE